MIIVIIFALRYGVCGNKMALKPIRASKTLENGEEEEALLSPNSRMFHEPNYNMMFTS